MKRIPGLALTSLVAWLGLHASVWIGETLLGFETSPISGIMITILIGLTIGNLVVLPATFKPGITFSSKILLRMGIVLLGIRLGLGDAARLGAMGFPVIVLCLAGALLITRWLGGRLTLPPRMSTLIAVGTSICGATAIVATAPAIEAREEETSYAIANITVFGILTMFLYPYVAHTLFPNDPTSVGLFLGTAIHETAQVAGSGLIYSEIFNLPKALDVATVTKLVRNLFMVGVIPMMSYLYRRSTQQETKIKIAQLFPYFIIGFVFMTLVRTVGDVTLEHGRAWGVFSAATWSDIVSTVKTWAENFLAMAMAGIGLGTRFKELRSLGIRPFYVGFGAAVAVGGVSLLGIELLKLLGV